MPLLGVRKYVSIDGSLAAACRSAGCPRLGWCEFIGILGGRGASVVIITKTMCVGGCDMEITVMMLLDWPNAMSSSKRKLITSDG